jgi:predicted nucleic acid-binding protein
MARSPRRVGRLYWDSCAWIAQIWNESVILANGVVEKRGALCRAVIDEATKGAAEIFTSALALVEVNKHPDPDAQTAADKLKDFFENDYRIVVTMDRRAGEIGRDLMRRQFPGLKPPDAAHLASALVANVEELHTFDGRLLNLDRKVAKPDGTTLKICKPSMGGPPFPLLESPAEQENTNGTDGQPSTDQTPPTDGETSAAIPGGSEGTGMPGGRDGIQQDAEADSPSGAGAETPAREAPAQALTPSGSASSAPEV